MVQKICEVVDYEKRLQGIALVPRKSYGLSLLMEGSGLNINFIACLFCHQPIAMRFPMDAVLLRTKLHCNTWGRQVPQNLSVPEGLCWRCRKKDSGIKCSDSR